MTLAYWCVFICIFLPIFCAVYAKKSAGFTLADNANPRAFLAKAEGKAARANAAQQNGYEVFPPFAAAVIIAHVTGGADQLTINVWALLFVLSRIVYIWAYISDKSLLRSVIFNVNALCIVALFIAAV
ncbi:MAG: MAPEG family protein [Neisseria sp.]|uniref:MAPEG family protein n=1 Tax=Neisseria sp. TaxID=192066 RepID=UPI0026DD1092|nr:MAPEG family protein [Neisseria sp.]MDO4640933.1 MAPEG family protein [Neisseria sp.]